MFQMQKERTLVSLNLNNFKIGLEIVLNKKDQDQGKECKEEVKGIQDQDQGKVGQV